MDEASKRSAPTIIMGSPDAPEPLSQHDDPMMFDEPTTQWSSEPPGTPVPVSVDGAPRPRGSAAPRRTIRGSASVRPAPEPRSTPAPPPPARPLPSVVIDVEPYVPTQTGLASPLANHAGHPAQRYDPPPPSQPDPYAAPVFPTYSMPPLPPISARAPVEAPPRSAGATPGRGAPLLRWIVALAASLALLFAVFLLGRSLVGARRAELHAARAPTGSSDAGAAPVVNLSLAYDASVGALPPPR